MAEAPRAPFPWFGGKRRVADVVWRAFGADCPNYIEPFAGSLAVLLARPGGAGKIETVNDADRYLANFWRAVTAAPEAVAAAADWPVNEADLHARHRWLVNQAEFRERMHTDPDFFDVKIAGWWVWGLCQWIGGGWCVEPQPMGGRKIPKLDGMGKGVHSEKGHGKARNERARTRPNMSGTNAGEGVHSPRARGADRVDEANRPELAGAGKGVHSGTAHQRKRPVLDGTALGRGVHSEGSYEPRRQMPLLWVGTSGVGTSGVGTGGSGVHSLANVDAYSPGRRPAISSAGSGVHLPSLGNDRGLNGVAAAPCASRSAATRASTRCRRAGPSTLGRACGATPPRGTAIASSSGSGSARTVCRLSSSGAFSKRG